MNPRIVSVSAMRRRTGTILLLSELLPPLFTQQVESAASNDGGLESQVVQVVLADGDVEVAFSIDMPALQ